MNGWALINLAMFWLVTGYAVFLFAHVVYSRYLFIRLGRARPLRAELRERLADFAAQVFGQRVLLQDRRSGLMHLVFFYGFILLQFGAVDLIGKGLRPDWHLPLGPAYPYFTLLQEITVGLVLAAAAYAFHRRYVEKLTRLKRGWKAGLVLLFIASLMLSVVVAEGFRIVWQGHPATGFQPLSSLLAAGLEGASPAAAAVGFYAGWWLHLLILLSFLVYVPQSKHAHLLFAPFNIWLRRRSPPGRLEPIDFTDETQEEYGAGRIERFSRDQLLDLYACVECGRCTSACPASGTGKTLSPMDIIVKLRDHLTEKGAAVTSRTPWMPALVLADAPANRWARRSAQALARQDAPGASVGGGLDPADIGYETAMIDEVITEQELWACTTCRSCEERCPVANEHVGFIVEMRRHLVMMEGRLPAEAQRTLNNMERQGNPWGLNRHDRLNWRESLVSEGVPVPTVREAPDFEWLLYVGSMGSYDARSMRVTRAFVKLMQRAGVRFAVLGNDERNSGDTARRLGNEYLFQQLASETVELFRRAKVRRIVTIDPHAYNTFKHEYPDFGLSPEVEVRHHTELIAEWLAEGRLRPVRPLAERIVYHDSCYLGRYNGLYDGPRDILRALPGVELAEMARSRANSQCCGAGGGLMWLEEREGRRMNLERTEQALAVRPTIIGSACPYCLTMLNDGTTALEAGDKVRTLDIAEIVALAVE